MPDFSPQQGLDSWEIVTLLECLLGASTARTSRENLVSTAFAACGSTLFLLGARTSSGVSTGRPSGSATRKQKCLSKGVRPVASHESDEPRRSNTPGSFLENAHGTHISPALSVKVVIAWRLPAQRHFSSRRSDRDTAPFFVPIRTKGSSSAHAPVV